MCVACEVVLTEKQKIVIGDTGAFFDNFDDGTKSFGFTILKRICLWNSFLPNYS